MIQDLIPQPQAFELVRDRIAEIIAAETVQQQAIAITNAIDPALYAVRVFTERANPIGEWTFTDEGEDERPIVNVMFKSLSIGGMDGDVVRRQSYDATYDVDCYGYAIAFEDEYGATHSADEFSAREAQRAAGLVRAILMAAEYAYLGFPRGAGQLVGKRWITSVTAFERQADERTVQSIQGVRLSLSVRIQEVSPQVIGNPFEGYGIEILRADNGEILAALDIGEADSL